MLMATWEVLLGTVAFGLSNGGPSGLIYTYIGVFTGFTLVSASMAEMASRNRPWAASISHLSN